MKETSKVFGTIAAAGVARATVTAFVTTVHAHRELSHRSLRLSPILGRLADFENRTMTVDSKTWAANHREHHHPFADGDVYHIWKAARVIRECEEHGIEVPEQYAGYDPRVDAFTKDEMLAVGEGADEHLQEKMGDDYPEFTGLTEEDVADLWSDTPRYYYDEEFHDRKKVFTDEEAAHFFLRDQHTPLDAPPNEDGTRNGVRYVLHKTRVLAGVTTRLYRQRPHLMPPDLQPEKHEQVRSSTPEVVAGFALMGLAVLAANRKFGAKDVARAAAIGSAANSFGLLALNYAGGAVNAYGHMGRMTPKALWQATFNRNFEPEPYPDGTLASDTINGGVAGRTMSILTGDEAGQQRGHHLEPGAIAFPDGNGDVRFSNSPWGSILEKAADSKWVPGIKRGPGLPISPEGKRPDEWHPVMEIVHEARARTLRERAAARSGG